MDELVSAGTIGLLEAAERFDSRRGVPFASFAYLRIKGAILDEIARLRDRGAAADVSLHAPVIGDPTLALIDVVADPQSADPTIVVELVRVLEELERLPRRERRILTLYTAGHTLAEIAKRDGCSEPRASQILTRARLRLAERVA